MDNFFSLNYQFLIVTLFGLLSPAPHLTLKYKEECYMPEGCKWHKAKSQSTHRMSCRDLYAVFDLGKLKNKSNNICKPKTSSKPYFVSINFNQYEFTRKLILNNSFQLLSISKFMDGKFFRIYRAGVTPFYTFFNLRGIQADLLLYFEGNEVNSKYSFIDSDFTLYFKNGSSIIRTCEDYRNSLGQEQRNVFWTRPSDKNAQKFARITLHLQNCRFPSPICSFLFENSSITEIEVNNMVRYIF